MTCCTTRALPTWWPSTAEHQTAEKALKALFQRLGMEAWGHTLTALIGNLPQDAAPPSETLADYARMLDKHYIPTRYPNGFPSGAPTDFYTRQEAQAAVHHAEEILEFCSERLAKYKVPRYVEFREELPKTMVGKILRRELMEEEQKQGTT